MATDLSKSSIEQVLDLLRQSNNLTASDLTSNDVDLTDPTPLTGHPTGKNTGLIVSSKPNSRYSGNEPITYNRLAMSGLSQYGDLIIIIQKDDGENQILAAINTAYGCNLSFDDVNIINAELVDYDGEIVTFNAKATSLAWIGSIDLIVKWNQNALSSILTVNNLDGLHWPYMFKELIEKLTPRVGFTLHSNNLASAVFNGIVRFFANGTNFINHYKFDPSSQTYSTAENLAFANYSGRAAYDGVIYSVISNLSLATGKFIQTVDYRNFPINSNPTYSNYFLHWLDNVGIPSHFALLLAKKNNTLYFLFGSSVSGGRKWIGAAEEFSENINAIIELPSNATVSAVSSDVMSKSAIIGDNLFFHYGTSIMKLNLISKELETAVSSIGDQISTRMVALDNNIILVNTTTKVIGVYSELGGYRQIGLLTDYGFSSTSSFYVTMVNVNDSVYIFDINNTAPPSGRNVIRIT